MSLEPAAANLAAPPAGQPLCRLDEISDPGSRGFVFRQGDALFQGFVVRSQGRVRGFVDRCPHAGWPLALVDHQYLTRDGALILCQAHGAMFRPADGSPVSGPGRLCALTPWPVAVGQDGIVRTA